MKLSFQTKLFLSLVVFSSVLFVLLGSYYYVSITRQLYQAMSMRAKVQADEIALIPELKKAVADRDITTINVLMKAIARKSDASFIVIGDN